MLSCCDVGNLVLAFVQCRDTPAMINKFVTMVSMRTNFFISLCMGIVRHQDSTSQLIHNAYCDND